MDLDQNKIILANDTNIDYDIGVGGVEGSITNTTMSNNTNTNATNTTGSVTTTASDDSADDDDVVSITNEDGKLIGYQCDHVVQTNTLQVVELVFYLDISSPIGKQKDAINYLSESLVENVANQYEISSENSKACTDPHLDGRSWLVQFSAEPTDFKRVDLFDECRKYPYDKTTQDCFVYETLVKGSALGSQDIPDVMQYVEDVFDSTVGDLTVGTEYGTAFLGVPVVQQGVSDEGRDSLGNPTNLNEVEKEVQQEPEGQSVTIIGGFLVALFAIGFCGIGMVLWKRRKSYLEHHREMKLSSSRDQQKQPSHLRSASSDGLHQYDTHVTTSDEDNNHHIHSHRHRGASGGEGEGVEVDDLASPTPTEEDFPNDVTFDLGSTFKSQLMGTHASTPSGGGGGPPRPYGSNSNSGRNMMGMMGLGGGYGGGMGGIAPSADGTDASEADSWAQTDGTIGSLEIQLEPVTAEV